MHIGAVNCKSDEKAQLSLAFNSQASGNTYSLMSFPLIEPYLFLMLNHLIAPRTLLLRFSFLHPSVALAADELGTTAPEEEQVAFLDIFCRG